MDSAMEFDPFAYASLGVYFATIFGAGLLLLILHNASRGGAWGVLQKAIAQARQMSEIAWAQLPGNEFLIYGKGQLAGTVGKSDTGDYSLKKVERIALVKDMDRQTGLVITTGGQNACVTGLEEMARIYTLIQKDDAPVAFVFREDEGETMNKLLGKLHFKEKELLGGWLTDKEMVTDIIDGVDYEGELQTAGSKGSAKLIVTNLRVGLLAQTVETERVGNATRTTTHFNLIGYLLPLAEKVILERTSDLSERKYLMRLQLPAEHENTAAPVLKLTKDHTGVFLPMVLFNRPVEVIDHTPGFGRVIFETLLAGFGWGILFGGLAIGAAIINTEVIADGGGHMEYRYTVPIVLAGMFSPMVYRGLSIFENFMERTRAAKIRAA